MPGLLVKEGEAGGTILELKGERVSIGRGQENDVRLDDRTVSRCHALVAARADGWYISDLGSHNSTLLNGVPVVEARLAHGDEIRLGGAVLVFFDEEVGPSDLLLPHADASVGEITQTVSIGDFGSLEPGGACALSDTADGEHRLSQLLALTELAISVRTVEALFDGVVRILRGTLAVDRAIPILQEGETLRPYLESRHEMADGLDALRLSAALLQRCRTEGIAGTWRGASGGSNVACAPVRVGAENHGFIYCDRSAASAEFTRRDLTYLLAVAMQTGLAMESIRSRTRMASHARSLSRQLGERYYLVGESEPMLRVYEFIRKVAPTDAGVLICGESGTGKEMVARAIHRHSRRTDGPLEIANCAAMQATLLESELFGHVRGAFTGAVADKPGRFELADGGTLFLDEVAELPLECQTKLLRVLEEGQVRCVGDTRDRRVDVRVIAATNRDVGRALAEGRLRQDLFFRLDRLRVEMPPLRERGKDVELLAHHFLEEMRGAFGREVEGFAPEVVEAFRAYSWPGNVRELRNVVERMVLLADARVLGLDEVPPEVRAAASGAAGRAVEPLRDMERKHILRALEAADGNKKRAAQMLGVDRSTLYEKLKRYGMRPSPADGRRGGRP